LGRAEQRRERGEDWRCYMYIFGEWVDPMFSKRSADGNVCSAHLREKEGAERASRDAREICKQPSTTR